MQWQAGKGASNNNRGGRGGRGGGRNSRGGRGRGRGAESKPQTKEDLDADMDAYFLKDKKSGGSYLDNDLDSYFANRQKKDEAAATEEATEAAADAEADPLPVDES